MKNNFKVYFSLKLTSHFTSPLFSKVLIKSLSKGGGGVRPLPPPKLRLSLSLFLTSIDSLTCEITHRMNFFNLILTTEINWLLTNYWFIINKWAKKNFPHSQEYQKSVSTPQSKKHICNKTIILKIGAEVLTWFEVRGIALAPALAPIYSYSDLYSGCGAVGDGAEGERSRDGASYHAVQVPAVF